MRIEIEIPKEFETDYNGDKFKEFFSRVLCDIENGTLCGNYEKETAEMFLKAFDESKPAYDENKVALELRHLAFRLPKDYSGLDGKDRAVMFDDAIDIVRKGGIE